MASSNIAMLGLGSMNSAILTGLLSSGVSSSSVTATSRSAESATRRADEHGVTVLSEERDGAANKQAVAEADVVFLGVKPYQITDLCTEIKDALKPEAVVVSVAAAVTLDVMESALRPGQPAVRAMPNTPMSVGQGVVGLAIGQQTTQAQAEAVVELLSASGAVHILAEDQIDALTGVAGSGPAYVFYLAEQMAAAGVEMGLDPELAADLAAQTVYGAGKMLVENPGPETAAQLRRHVTSPNGTTQHALEAFDAADTAATLRAGAKASAARAAELTAQLSQGST